MKRCPRCAAEIYSNMKKCPRCGLPVSEMDFSEEEIPAEPQKKMTKNERKAFNKKKKEQRKQEKREQRLKESRSDTDFSKFATNRTDVSGDDATNVDELLKKNKKRNKNDLPQFQLDENGEFNIDTSDVEVVGEEGAKIIEERFGGNSYSVKKERGDYRPPKIKWWELYKITDRSFARRKIKKEVNKAAKIKPDFIKKWKLLLLAILFGWMGAHNFYAKNFKKGWVSLICIVLSMTIIGLGDTVPFFAQIRLSIGGFTGFVALFIWITDIISIIFNSFKYRIQKEEFIFNMNIETRAKLGEKYIDLELYKKPWWVRMKAWFVRKKRDFEEWRHDRRQAMIDKEKRKQELEKQRQEEALKKASEDAEQEALLKELRSFQNEGEPVADSETSTAKKTRRKKSDGTQSSEPKSSPAKQGADKTPAVSETEQDKSKAAETTAEVPSKPRPSSKPKAKLTTKKNKKK